MTIKTYFSPNGGCLKAVVSAINKSQKTVDIAVYYFTSKLIARALVNAKERGVKVRIVLDKNQQKEIFSKSRYLIQRGFEVRYYKGEGTMHNKFAVVDKKALITGSFNWTPTADWKNEENLLIITNKHTVGKYSQRFEYLWSL